MSTKSINRTNVTVEKTVFGQTTAGRDIHLFTLKNSNGAKACVTNYGATLTHLVVPDREGEMTDVVLGFDRFEDYVSEASQKAGAFMGCTVGRVCNRIDHGQFELEGKQYQVAVTNGAHHLHGGQEGFDKKIWEANTIEGGVEFTYTSPDGEENYPGTLTVTVAFTLSEENELTLTYGAKTDKTTVVNLTNHSYFNLSGDLSSTILEHDLQVNAPFYVAVKEGSIPTGEILSVKGTPLDFLQTKKVKEGVEADHPQTVIANGLDQTLVFDKNQPAAVLTSEASGIRMEVATSEPGVQLYSANYFDGTLQGKGKTYPTHGGIALETQHFPDSPNHPHFPSVVLRPEERFQSYTSFKFSVIK
ncbi:galactose mutarotase [Echinicola strongylocentroti]|uniref:Aldose 1-epimerase n=1 Tax=Echinicola strongylocentroti TaxID=1795355 RepID=A0A2Z4IIP8_9BACT|nr:aldose epimerase family protein [Echinicola strongylocentroti]AWW30398.1 galactose mutarotase [Echinicola strongylocentroti]